MFKVSRVVFSILTLIVLSITYSTSSLAKQTINVGAYDFKPYYISNDHMSLISTTADILNRIQDKYQFKIVVLPAKRRYDSLSSGVVDIVLFEDPNWGWKEVPHIFLPLPIHDGEVYFTRKDDKNNQSFFDSFERKTIASILGFHYAITNFKDVHDGKNLPFHLINFPNADHLIDVVLKGRADLGIVAKSYLNYYMKKNPVVAQQILISDKLDHKYQMGFILRKKAPISSKELMGLMNSLTQDPLFKKETQNLGIQK